MGFPSRTRYIAFALVISFFALFLLSLLAVPSSASGPKSLPASVTPCQPQPISTKKLAPTFIPSKPDGSKTAKTSSTATPTRTQTPSLSDTSTIPCLPTITPGSRYTPTGGPVIHANVPVPPGGGSTIVVNSLADDDNPPVTCAAKCTLRDAIFTA